MAAKQNVDMLLEIFDAIERRGAQRASELCEADVGFSWFAQTVGPEIHVLEYLERSGEGLPFWIREVQRKAVCVWQALVPVRHSISRVQHGLHAARGYLHRRPVRGEALV
jgi:hypothetical protein